MICEICGSEVRHLRTMLVDRATLDVCDRCSRFGKPVESRVPQAPPTHRRATGPRKVSGGQTKAEYDVVDGYGALIRGARERKGLTQEELGKRVNEKSSTVHRLESQSLAPSLALARKLERFLKITLLEKAGLEEELESSVRSSSDDVTLGEVIRIRKPE
jgi:putative transcription factor